MLPTWQSLSRAIGWQMIQSLTGNLLVASSMATDPVYAQCVCLIVHQDESNVIGVMLNRPMKPSPEALLQILEAEKGKMSGNRLANLEPNAGTAADLSDADDLALTKPSTANDGPASPDDDPAKLLEQSLINQSPLGMLHFGGPRSGPVVAIHQTSQYAEAETGDGIYVAAQRQHLEDLVRDQPAPYRLIVGHVGWDLNEFVSEYDRGIWHVVPATTDVVFSDAEEMWPRLVRRATASSLAVWIGTKDVVGAGDLN